MPQSLLLTKNEVSSWLQGEKLAGFKHVDFHKRNSGRNWDEALALRREDGWRGQSSVTPRAVVAVP